MSPRNLFLLFFSAMTASLIIMLLVYGLFIRDNFEFDFEVKEPESAPTISDYENKNQGDEATDPARVQTPGESDVAKSGNDTIPADQQNPDDSGNQTFDDSQVGNGQDDGAPSDTSAGLGGEPLPAEDTGPPPVPEQHTPELPAPLPRQDANLNMRGDAAVPTLHYVYMDGFPNKAAAEQAINHMQGKDISLYPYIREHQGQVILQFGVYSSMEAAKQLANRLASQRIYTKFN